MLSPYTYICYIHDYYDIFQVEIMRSKEETEKLANELMNIEIPNYKPSTNHVKLFEKGNVM